MIYKLIGLYQYNTTYSTVSQKKVILIEMALTPLKSFISLKYIWSLLIV